MISRESELFAAHPDWAVGVPGAAKNRGSSPVRAQISREGKSSTIFSAAISDILNKASRVLRQMGHEPEY